MFSKMFGKKDLNRVDMNRWYSTEVFDSAIRWAGQYSSISGVNEAISAIQKNKQEYSREMGELLNQAQPELDKRFAEWEAAEKKKGFYFGVTIVALFIFLSNANIHFPHIIILDLLAFLLTFAPIAGITLLVISLIRSDSCKEKHTSYIKQLELKARQIDAKYEKSVNLLRNKIDNLYLNSLEPAHREMVLMRRDQERQHQELIHIEQQKLNSQRAAEEEQRRLRQTQEELLRIERDREERYRARRG